MNDTAYAALPTTEERRDIRRHYRRAGLIMLIFILVFHGLNFLVARISAGIIGGGFDSAAIAAGKKVINSDPVMRLIYGYGMPLAADIAAFSTGLLVTKAPIRKKFTLKGFSSKDFGVCTVMTFSLSTAAALISQIILAIIMFFAGSSSEAEEAVRTISLSADNAPLWVNILINLYACIIGPVFEELIFRGVLLEALRKYGNAFGIIASSIMFGLAHANYVQFIPAMVIGMVWAFTVIKTGSLIPTVTLHIINNTVAALISAMLTSVSVNDSNLIEMTESIMASMPLMIAVMINMIIRIGCVIASIIIIYRFYSSRKRLFTPSDYCKQRTWRYFLTSVIWIFCIGYLGYQTVTSIAL